MLQISIDGQKLRGTLSPQRPDGVYLLGAYLPHAGLMLFQVEIGSGPGELTLAPQLQLLNALDLQARKRVVTGDAEFTQRNLSAQSVAAGGDYVWKVKENQPTCYQDIADVFQAATDAPLPGFSSPVAGADLRTAEQWSAGHGRVERRRLTASRDLLGYADWPGLDQVFAYECVSTQKATGETTSTLTYGATSLSPQAACPRCLLHIVRDHWGIESGSHYRRDVTLQEDNAQLEVG
jgi:predicted transposase YbfD/YdcC